MPSPHQLPAQVGDTTNLLLKKLVTATQGLGGSGGIFLTQAEADALYFRLNGSNSPFTRTSATVVTVPDAFSLTSLGSMTLAPGGANPINLNATTGGVRIPSTNTAGLQLYNTVDQTNYERLVVSVASNTYRIDTDAGGIGTTRRNIRIGSSEASSNSITLRPIHSTLGMISIGALDNSVANSILLRIAAVQTQTSGTNIGLSLTPTYNQASGTAANTDLLINRTETAVGSGAQNLLDLQVGGTSRFLVNNAGNMDVVCTSTLIGSTLYGRIGQNVNSGRGFSIFNSSTGVNSNAYLEVSQTVAGDAADAAVLRMNSSGFTTSGIDLQDGASLLTGSNIGGGLVVGTRANAILMFATNGTERGGFTGAGLLYTAGQTSTPGATVGTLTNSPSVGNPDFWHPIVINGTTHWFPCWST